MFTLSFSQTGLVKVSLTTGAAPLYSIHLRNVSSHSPNAIELEPERGESVIINEVGRKGRILYINEIDSPTYATAEDLSDAIDDAIENMYAAGGGGGGGGGVSSVGATAPINSSGGSTPTISATTSDGGNGAADSGKILVFRATGAIEGSATATDAGVIGTASGSATAGVAGTGSGAIPGVVGTSTSGIGVQAISTSGVALKATNANLGGGTPIAEFANINDGTVVTVENDGSLSGFSDPAAAATRAALGIPSRTVRSLWWQTGPNGNSGTEEKDLFADTIPADTFTTDGDTMEINYGGSYVGSTSSKRLRVYIDGTPVFDMGAVAIGTASQWSIKVVLINSGGLFYYSITLVTGSATPLTYVSSDLIVVDPSVDLPVVLTGTASGVGAATNDVTALTDSSTFYPSPD